MALTLNEFNGMELFWKEFEKRPDENHVTLTLPEVDGIWQMGVVDTEIYSLDVWRKAFEEHKQPDDNYLLNKEEFLAKEKYRYKGEVRIPFDAMKINEGKYSNEGLQELFDLSIAPSCCLSKTELKDFLDDFKKTYRDQGGLIKIGKDAKLKIKKLIEEKPSPLRRLELMFDYLFTHEKTPWSNEPDYKLTDIQPESGNYSLSPAQLAKLQASSFSMLPTSKAEVDSKILRSIEKSKSKKEVAEKSGVSLKKVKRSRKGVRG